MANKNLASQVRDKWTTSVEYYYLLSIRYEIIDFTYIINRYNDKHLGYVLLTALFICENFGSEKHFSILLGEVVV